MIDFVLPWVDGNDKEWQDKKANYSVWQDNDANSNSRFRDMDTLKYVLRGIEQNCPWYNKIYLITEGHYPDWLDINNDKIVLVTHNELYFNKSHLPIFNSVSIEMNLSNLKDISDKFVYLNDDMVVMSPLSKDRFFYNNKPVDFFTHGWIPRNKYFNLIFGKDTWIDSINNTLKLINSKFYPYNLSKEMLYHNSYSFRDKVSNFLFYNIYKKIFWLEHWHHPQPFLKETLEAVYNEFSEEMMESSKNRFRDSSDLNQYIYRYWQLVTQNFYPYKHNDALIANLGSLKILEKLIKKIEIKKNINFVCFNDSTKLEDNEYFAVKDKLINYLEKKFPKKASFEL